MDLESKKMLLLVEDEAIIALSQKLILEKYNYSVIIANSGESAIELVDASPHIDLILMDIDLGSNLDGTQTAALILAKHDIPVVFLSSHTESDMVEKTEKITSYGYVVKNTNITVLDASIKMALKLFQAKLRELAIEKSLMDSKAELNVVNQELSILNNFIIESNKNFDIATILQLGLDEAIKICGLEGGTVCVVTGENTLELTAERNTSEATKTDLRNNKIMVGECLCGKCALDQKPLILRTREEVLGFSSREAQRNEPIHFHAAFPIITKGISTGVLCVFTYTGKKPTERNLTLLATLTAQMSLLLENASLNQALNERVISLEKTIAKFQKDSA